MTKKLLALVLVVFIGMSFTVVNNDKLYEISKNIEIFVKIYKELNANYVDDLDPGQLMKTGIDAMVKSLDPYTNYMSESQVESYRISTDGKYEGLGAAVKMIGDYITVIEPYAGSPLHKAGIIAGDQIISINGQSTKGKTQEEVTQFVRGVAGTSMKLKLMRLSTKEEISIDLDRGQVDKPNVPYSGIIRDHVGYIALTVFTANATKNIRKAIKQLEREDPELAGIIIDLRSNGGGLLREAIGICNLFVEQDEEVVFTRGKIKERDQSFKTMDKPLDLEIPVTVLINKKSASASEIVSGVIQDLDRGVVIGQRSFGKGLVQNTYELGYNARVKLTTSKYYIPSGRCIQAVEYADGKPKDISDDQRTTFKTKNGRPVLDGGGVTPDIRLEAPEIPMVLEKLIEQDVIFNYVTKYTNGVAPLDSAEVETIHFDEFPDFVNFVKANGFEYNTKTEEKIKELGELAKEEGLEAQISSDLASMKSKLDKEKEMAINNYKDKIINAIQMEISARYYLQEGKAFQKLSDDPEVDEAIAILKNKTKYDSILKK